MTRADTPKMAVPVGPVFGMRRPKRTDGKPPGVGASAQRKVHTEAHEKQCKRWRSSSPGGGMSCSTFMSCAERMPGTPRTSVSVMAETRTGSEAHNV